MRAVPRPYDTFGFETAPPTRESYASNLVNTAEQRMVPKLPQKEPKPEAPQTEEVAAPAPPPAASAPPGAGYTASSAKDKPPSKPADYLLSPVII